MTTQQDQKIQELSDRNRTLVDKVSGLERELRSLQSLYAKATAKVFELDLRLEDEEDRYVEAQRLMDDLERKLEAQVELNQKLSSIGLGNNTALAYQLQLAQQDTQQGLLHLGNMLPVKKTEADNG